MRYSIGLLVFALLGASQAQQEDKADPEIHGLVDLVDADELDADESQEEEVEEKDADERDADSPISPSMSIGRACQAVRAAWPKMTRKEACKAGMGARKLQRKEICKKAAKEMRAQCKQTPAHKAQCAAKCPEGCDQQCKEGYLTFLATPAECHTLATHVECKQQCETDATKAMGRIRCVSAKQSWENSNPYNTTWGTEALEESVADPDAHTEKEDESVLEVKESDAEKKEEEQETEPLKHHLGPKREVKVAHQKQVVAMMIGPMGTLQVEQPHNGLGVGGDRAMRREQAGDGEDPDGEGAGEGEAEGDGEDSSNESTAFSAAGQHGLPTHGSGHGSGHGFREQSGL